MTQNAPEYLEEWYEPMDEVTDNLETLVAKHPGYRIKFMFLVYPGKKEGYRIIFEKRK